MGIMIPPSIPLIIYGILAEESIPRLFLAGVMPGILEGGLYIAWIAWYSRHKKFVGGPRATLADTLHATGKATPAFSLPFIVGGIYSGFVTVTEAAALGSRRIHPHQPFYLPGGETLRNNPFKRRGHEVGGDDHVYHLHGHRIRHLADRVGHATAGSRSDYRFDLIPYLFLLLINIILLIMGMFLEVASIMLITLPILLPVVRLLGIDLFHFGIVMTVNMELALVTPPVGLNLYVISGVAKAPLWEVIKGTFPFTCLGIHTACDRYLLARFQSLFAKPPHAQMKKHQVPSTKYQVKYPAAELRGV